MQKILLKCRSFFIYTGLFSFFVTILSLAPIFYMLQILDRVISSKSNETLLMLTLIVVFALAIDAFLQILRSRLLIRFMVTLQQMLGPLVMDAGLKQKEGSETALSDLGTLQSFLTGRGLLTLFDLPWIPVFLVLLYYFHPILAAIALVGALILFGLSFLEEKATYKNRMAAASARNRSGTFARLSVRNAEAAAALGMREQITDRWWQLNQEGLYHQTLANNASSTIQSLSTFVKAVVKLCGLGTAAYLVLNADMSTGIMIAGNILMGRAMMPIVQAIAAWNGFIDARAAYRNLSQCLYEDGDKPEQLTLPEPKGYLSVQNAVLFLSRDKRVLSGVSFNLKAGEMLGVIGPSAAGKTSLARLVTGYYKASGGYVRLDGADVFQWAQKDLGRYIGYVPQDVELFTGTVAENIARLGETKHYEREIVEAARLARVHEMILHLPDGYDTEIGEGGQLLSGGQRQQIALARALFGNPKLVVMDEPNSNLDGESEVALLQVLNDLKRSGVTMMIISHKPSSLNGADKLLVLQTGGYVNLYGPRDEVLPQITRSRLEQKKEEKQAPALEGVPS